MKIENMTLQAYLELCNNLPEVPHGKELVRIEYSYTNEGELALYQGNWVRAIGNKTRKFPVAIFKNTLREDGTPFSIKPLPDYYHNYSAEYMTPGDYPQPGDEVLVLDSTDPYDKQRWEHITMVGVGSGSEFHYARLIEVKKATTLDDLIENGNCWIINEDNERYLITGIADDIGVNFNNQWRFRGNDDVIGVYFNNQWQSLKALSSRGNKWSNDPGATYDTGNEFIPET